MYDFLYDTPVYQHIMRQGREKGLEEGRQEGLQEKIQELRETLLEVILELFPRISIPAQEQVDAITNTRLLRQLIVKMYTFKSPEEALQFLREVNGK